MKTSNKVLIGFIVVYLVFTVISTFTFMQDYNATSPDAKALFKQLENTRIRTLHVTGNKHFQAVTLTDNQVQIIGIHDIYIPENIRISHDTLYIADTWGYLNAPDLESFLQNGKPQRIPKSWSEK